MKKHEYMTSLRWTGNRGTGTSDYKAYSRDHEITGPKKTTTLQCSSDAHFRGDATGTMAENPDGSGEFKEVILRPRVTITAGSSAEKAMELHEQAGKLCFIARSVNFTVRHEPIISNS